MTCIFCNQIKEEQVLSQSEYFMVVFDIDPMQEGHILIIAKEHEENYESLSLEKILDLFEFEKKIIGVFKDNFAILDVSLIQNNGATMDTGTHFHKHILPRYENDNLWLHAIPEEHKLDIDKLRRLLNNQ